MGNYDRLVKDSFRKTNPSNPLHYYGYKHIARGEKNKRREEKDKGEYIGQLEE